MMKAALLLPLLLLLSAIPAFSHGVERGSVMEAINGEEMASMSDATKARIIQEVLTRCDLTGLVFVSAGVTGSHQNSIDPELTDSIYDVELRLQIEGRFEPVTILIEAKERRERHLNSLDTSIVSIQSPICR